MPPSSPGPSLSDEHYNRNGALKKKIYERELIRLQIEPGKLQRHIADLLEQFDYPSDPIPTPQLPPRPYSDDSYERDPGYLDA